MRSGLCIASLKYPPLVEEEKNTKSLSPPRKTNKKKQEEEEEEQVKAKAEEPVTFAMITDTSTIEMDTLQMQLNTGKQAVANGWVFDWFFCAGRAGITYKGCKNEEEAQDYFAPFLQGRVGWTKAFNGCRPCRNAQAEPRDQACETCRFWQFALFCWQIIFQLLLKHELQKHPVFGRHRGSFEPIRNNHDCFCVCIWEAQDTFWCRQSTHQNQKQTQTDQQRHSQRPCIYLPHTKVRQRRPIEAEAPTSTKIQPRHRPPPPSLYEG
ncbi:unnamed protein product [Rotaria magnacalcarata]|uniref:Uncharacterized protein n=1 Tax=Rotaria magnacalcarata TaxID=392030 RepID=A0A815A413_9BILA|nr:unnamed protein product [Rotaria magnacalcarata]CAF3818375.1 unnamed protein product [Rotaria magnacalcarata]